MPIEGPALPAPLRNATAALKDAGYQEPQEEALRLLATVTTRSVAATWQGRGEPLSESVAEKYQRAVIRRCGGEPLAYAAGSASFRHLELTVNRSVLIPRPETEGLIDLALAWAAGRQDERLCILEIGVGSGCIALSLATEGRFARIVGTEVSESALRVARRNLHRVRPACAVELRQGSLFEPVAGERFDLIVSNPPYIAVDEYDALDASVRDYEPAVALVSPDQGMFHINQICAGAIVALQNNGLLLLEIDERRSAEARQAAISAGFDEVDILQDVFGADRYLRAARITR